MRALRGQVWSVLVNSGPGQKGRPRIEVKVVRVRGNAVLVETVGPEPKRLHWRRRVLERGLRGAHLVSGGDTERALAIVKERVSASRIVTDSERRTASEVRKRSGPKGVATCSDRDREASRLVVDEGLSYVAAAEKLQTTKSHVRLMVERVRTADYDARAVKALG